MSDLLVLCYHAVSESWPAALSITPAALDRQLAVLVARGYRGARLTEAVTQPTRTPTVVVSFDDNYRSVLDLAKPILDRHGLPGTLYVPTAWPDHPKPMSWPGIGMWLGTEHESELHSLRWDELRELADSGWEIGSHTCSHPHLPELSEPELARELCDSRAKIEVELERPCTSMAYPYGSVDKRVEDATDAAGYLAGASIPRVLHPPRSFCWPRTPIFHRDTDVRFRAKTSPLLRKVRRARLTQHLDRARLAYEQRFVRDAPAVD